MAEHNSGDGSAGRGDQANHTRGTRSAATKAKAAVKQTAREARRAASRVAHDAAEEVQCRTTTFVDEQKAGVAERIRSVAEALQHVADDLSARDPMIGGVAEDVAHRVEALSDHVQQHDVSELIGEVNGFARRHPAIFFTAAFVAGVAAARFIRSSRKRRERDMYAYDDDDDELLERAFAEEQSRVEP